MTPDVAGDSLGDRWTAYAASCLWGESEDSIAGGVDIRADVDGGRVFSGLGLGVLSSPGWPGTWWLWPGSRLTLSPRCNSLGQRRAFCAGAESLRDVVSAQHSLGLVNPLLPFNWPEDFPKDCPPEHAPHADGTYYRIVRNDPPEQSDFVSIYNLNRKRAEVEIGRGRRTQCETMGLSVYSELIHAIECAKQYPKLGDKIARLCLTPASGKAVQTGRGLDSHNTWWKALGFDPLESAQVIQII